MNPEALIHEVRTRGGRVEARGDHLHVEAPRGAIDERLRLELAANKESLLATLNAQPDSQELQAAFAREGRIRIDSDWAGTVWLVASRRHDDDPAETYTPEELRFLVQLAPDQRQLLHGFKRAFNATIEPSKRDPEEM